jgi:hypothetical protein
MISGYKPISPGALLILADKLHVSRVELFQQAGWLNSSNDEKIMSVFREPIAGNKPFFS